MKNINQPHTNRIPEPVSVIQKAVDFLLLFIPKILAKRVVAIILLAADVPVPRGVELSGACDRTVRGLLRSLKKGKRTAFLRYAAGPGQDPKSRALKPKSSKSLRIITITPSGRLLT